MLLSMVPVQDRYNLILINKSALLSSLILILSLSNLASSSAPGYILDVDNYIDYSFTGLTTCENVIINLDNNKINGIIHSPDYKLQNSNDLINYFKKCNWLITAPQGYNIQLTKREDSLVKCPGDKLEFVGLSPEDKFWISLYEPFEQNGEENIQETFFNKLSSCDLNFKSFLSINTNSNRLEINYNTENSNLNFLLKFSLTNTSKDETTSKCSMIKTNFDQMKCEIEFKAPGNESKTLKHYTCIDKDLLCNCLSLKPITESQSSPSPRPLNLGYLDTCDYLIETYASYLTSLSQTKSTLCDYYLGLNTKCRNENLLLEDLNQLSPPISLIEDDAEPVQFSPPKTVKPGLDSVCASVLKTNEFGWIASPNFYTGSRNYESNLTCSFYIKIQPYQTIQLRFKHFYLNPMISDANVEITTNSARRSKVSKKLNQDSLVIYDGPNTDSAVLARYDASNNDFKANFHAKAINSKTNFILIQFRTQIAKFTPLAKQSGSLFGFNMTYQIKGYCIENQKQCNSIFELNCYAPEQACNDVWDCHNGADERGCEPCNYDQFKCRNNIFCYRLEDRCDGDHQCIDKSDELNCDKWTCNSENGTFLCNNGKCVYEQWVCDGTNDCDDGSDEINCPTSLTSRRVITTAVLGGTLCCLLLVMALGCACKLYTLHTATYRSSMRFSQRVQSGANTTQIPAITAPSTRHRRRASRHRARGSVYNNLSSFMRRLRSDTAPNPPRSDTSTTISLLTNQTSTNTDPQTQTQTQTVQSNLFTSDLPLPHHLIAPPTYNQTMGLVDEYEQRQLAFIEHVRSILSQQQQNGSSIINLGNGTQMSSMSIIPTVTSSSTTTVHRVTSSSRRHGQSRHHRHHYRPSNPTEQGQTESHRHRSHRRRHANLSTIPGSSTASTTSQINFDLNRRGLQFIDQINEQDQQSQSDQQLVGVPECSGGASGAVQEGEQLNGKSTSVQTNNSVNLRDRIAKLIKDIVVHHGDNIQYVQLAEQSQMNCSSVDQNQDEVLSSPIVNASTDSSSRSSNSNASEDDVPLIQP